MTTTRKASIQTPFLLRRKLIVEGLEESQWDDFLYDLNHHPCVEFAELKNTNQLWLAYDGSHWSVDELLALITSHEPHCCSKIPPMKRK